MGNLKDDFQVDMNYKKGLKVLKTKEKKKDFRKMTEWRSKKETQKINRTHKECLPEKKKKKKNIKVLTSSSSILTAILSFFLLSSSIVQSCSATCPLSWNISLTRTFRPSSLVASSFCKWILAAISSFLCFSASSLAWGKRSTKNFRSLRSTTWDTYLLKDSALKNQNLWSGRHFS